MNETQKIKKAPYILSGLFSITILFLILIRPYLIYGLIPVGWDTPWHIASARILVERGLNEFLLEIKYVSFLYQMMLAAFLKLGFDIFVVRIILTVFLSITLALLYAKLTFLYTRNIKLSMLVLGICSTYVSLYRFSADLHKTLLAYVLFLGLITTLKMCNRYWTKISTFSFFLLISLTQLEAGSFFAGILVLYQLMSVIQKRLCKKELLTNTLVILGGLAPAFYIAFPSLALVIPLSYPVPLVPPHMENILLLLSFPLVFLPVAGLVIVAHEARSEKKTELPLLTFVWSASIIILVFCSYIIPVPLAKYAQRAILLLPIPLLSGYTIQKVLSKTIIFRVFIFIRERSMNISWIIPATLLFLIVSPPLVFAYQQSTIHHRPFISRDTYNKFLWLRTNLGADEKPIFVIYNPRPEVVFMWDNWISSVWGLHLRYCGSLSFLLAMKPTPSKNFWLQQFSTDWFTELMDAGIKDDVILMSHKLVIIDDFYYSSAWELSSTLMEEPFSGVFLANISDIFFLSPKNFSFLSYYELTGPWYSSVEPWSQNPTLKVYLPASSGKVNVTLAVPILKDGNYSLQIRYFDSTPKHSPINVYINDTAIGTITYKGSLKPAIWEINVSLTMGTTFVTLNLEDTTKPFYVILDTLTLEANLSDLGDV